MKTNKIKSRYRKNTKYTSKHKKKKTKYRRNRKQYRGGKLPAKGNPGTIALPRIESPVKQNPVKENPGTVALSHPSKKPPARGKVFVTENPPAYNEKDPYPLQSQSNVKEQEQVKKQPQKQPQKTKSKTKTTNLEEDLLTLEKIKNEGTIKHCGPNCLRDLNERLQRLVEKEKCWF